MSVDTATLIDRLNNEADYLERTGHRPGLVATLREAAAALASVANEREAYRDHLRGAMADIIAIKGHLDTPYPDDPRWTPWTRFAERALRRIDDTRDWLKSLAASSSVVREAPEMSAASGAPDGEETS